MFRRWAHLEERVLGVEDRPEPAERAQLHDDARRNESFIRAMHYAGRESVAGAVDRIDLTGVRTVADLGGGPGHFLVGFLRRLPEAEGHLVDLPLTLRTSRRVLADSPVRDRIRFVEWDLYDGERPAALPPLDLAFLSQVVHSETAERNRALMRRLLDAVAPGGRLVVRENVVDEGRTSPPAAALFAVNMLAMTPGGRTYTEAEIASWGREAGFAFEGGVRVNERSYLLAFRRPR
jgi:SAM-dependent methyltransferase